MYGAIAGSIAEAFFGIPDELKLEGNKRLGEDMLTIIRRFYNVSPGTFTTDTKCVTGDVSD